MLKYTHFVSYDQTYIYVAIVNYDGRDTSEVNKKN